MGKVKSLWLKFLAYSDAKSLKEIQRSMSSSHLCLKVEKHYPHVTLSHVTWGQCNHHGVFPLFTLLSVSSIVPKVLKRFLRRGKKRPTLRIPCFGWKYLNLFLCFFLSISLKLLPELLFSSPWGHYLPFPRHSSKCTFVQCLSALWIDGHCGLLRKDARK